jgi:NADH dehydrogenase
MARICVFGGAGFIGRHLVERLVSQQHLVIVPTRNRERAKRDLITLPTVDLVAADVNAEGVIDRLVSGCDAAVNLIGVLHSRRGRPYGPAFARAHVELPRRIAVACVAHGVKRLIHFSALCAAEDGPSEYLRSKAAGEREVLNAPGPLEATVLRPSVVFGPEDRFLNMFAWLQRFLPVVALVMPGAKFQPVFVNDVAKAAAASLTEDRAVGRIYDLAGPKVYTLRELVECAGAAAGHPRPIIGLNRPLSLLQGLMMEWLPVKLLSRDNIRSMQIDSITSAPFPFGIQPVPLEAIAPSYLGRRHLESRYDRFRQSAVRH